MTRLARHRRECMFCGGVASVLAPADADELDVDAEFSAEGRGFGDENEQVGVGCYRCSRRQWRLNNADWNRAVDAERRHLTDLTT
jgi:hypothetical protein